MTTCYITLDYWCIIFIYMSKVMRKPVLCRMQTTKMQISLRICAV